MAAYTNLILAIPHSTGEFDFSLWLDPELVSRDVRLWTDWHTDKLFSLDGMTNSRIRRLIGSVSRFDCDLERLEDDPLESEGQGRLYRRSHAGATRETIPPERAAAWLSLWAEWRVAARYFSLDCQRPLLIDCHSFPSAFAPDVDFCIGFNDDATRPPDEALAIVRDVIEASGYRVSFNAPYSNALAPAGLRETRISRLSVGSILRADVYRHKRRDEKHAPLFQTKALVFQCRHFTLNNTRICSPLTRLTRNEINDYSVPVPVRRISSRETRFRVPFSTIHQSGGSSARQMSSSSRWTDTPRYCNSRTWMTRYR